MNPTNHNTSLDHVLSTVLRLGLFLAIVVVFYGGFLLLWQSGFEVVDYRIFDGESASLKEFSHILEGVAKNNPLSIIQLGIIILLSTPILRVLSCLILFAAERDMLYVTISAIVLAILLYANF